jgi:hypothetical protein
MTRPLARIVLLFVVWWVALQTFALLGFFRFRLAEPDQAYLWTSQTTTMVPEPWRGFVDLHSRFDSGFYTWIAGEGYTRDNAAFPPFYPFAIKVVVTLWCAPFGLEPPSCDYPLAAFLVSNLSALGATLVLYRLARLDSDETRSERGAYYFLLFPSAYFLTTIYSEPLYILMAALSLYFARIRKWPLAGVTGALALLTRVSALALFVALSVEFAAESWRSRNWRDLRWLWLLLIPLAFFAFEYMLTLQGLSFFETQRALWAREPLNLEQWARQLDWDHLWQQPAAQVNFALDIGLTLFVLVCSALMALRWRASYAVYCALCVLLPLSTIQTLSLDRYALAAFCVPLFIGRFGHHAWLDRAYTLGATLLLALYTLLFVQGYWAG